MRRALAVLLTVAALAASHAAQPKEARPGSPANPEAKAPPPAPAPAEPELALPAGGTRRPILVPSAGFGWATEAGVAGPTPHLRVGLGFEYAFTRWLAVQATVRDHFYRREYILDRVDLSSDGLARVGLDEQKLDAEAFALFQLLRGPRLRLSLGAGPVFRFFLNQALPSNIGALALTGRADLRVADSLDVSVGAGWGYNLFFANSGLASALGAPRAVTSYRAGLAYHLRPDLRFVAGYEGEALTLERAYRLYHSVAFLLEVPLGKAPDTVTLAPVPLEAPLAPAAVPNPPRGQLSGRVLDAVTRAPLADAIISLPGRSRLLSGADGSFAATDLKPGALTVKAERSGFAPTEARADVTGGKEVSIQLLMKPAPGEPAAPLSSLPSSALPVTLKGSVISESGAPLAANVSVPSAGLEPRPFPKGDYELTTSPGALVVEASAPGHLTQARPIVARPGETVVVDFVLHPSPKKILIVVRKDKIEIKQQVHFAVNKAVILLDSAPLLDQVAAALLENPHIARIRVEGHTDDQGDDAHNLDLSARRARSVLQALVARGVEPSRLSAVGFGETRPVAPNKSEKQRRLNRRVEFMIEASP